MIQSHSTQSRRVDEFVDRYERAHALDQEIGLEAFLPNPSDPDYASIAVEIMRVDLEYRWDRGSPKSLHEYREAYGDLLSDPKSMHELAFEEYRLRLQSGEAVEPGEYSDRYRIDAHQWPQTDAPVDAGSTVQSFAGCDGDVARLADTIQPFPDIGEPLGPFRLLEQIGQGAFGRVYRASQGDLASRHVALKITTTRSMEPDRLARLQHTNIVPIYSIHRHEALYAICMPWLGTTTFAEAIRKRRSVAGLPETGRFFVQLLPSPQESSSDDRAGPQPIAGTASRLHQLKSMSYVEACVLLASELTDGLAHAHDRGIVHRDLKPANLLLTDEGRPMLLDFNTSDEVVAGGTASLFVGGTLPYMAPEHLRALETGHGVDVRSDIYSFGVVFYELLTGRLPVSADQPTDLADEMGFYVSGSARHLELDLERIAQARSQANTDVRADYPAIPAAVASIVDRCLASDPDHRYQSVRQLREDLRRQIEHRPLRFADNTSWREIFAKWRRRHPRLASLTTAAILTALIATASVAGMIVQRRALRQLNAQQVLTAVQHSLPQLRVMLSSSHSDPQTLKRGRDQAREVLSRIGHGSILSRIESEIENSDNGVSRENDSFASLTPWLDDGGLVQSGLNRDEQQRLRDSVAEVLYLLAATECKLLRGVTAIEDGAEPSNRWLVAAKLNQMAIDVYVRQGGRAPDALQVQRNWIQRAGADGETDADDVSLVDRLPMREGAHDYLWALELMRQGHPREAIPLLEQLRKDHRHDYSVWLLLGDAHLSVGDREEAKSCYDACTTLWPDSPMCFFHRGIYYLYQERYLEAITDFDETLRRQAGHSSALLNRAIARLELAQYRGAEEDLTAALNGGATQTRIYFLRARARAGAGDDAGAALDRQEGMRQTPRDPASCIVRGNEVLKQNTQEALAWYRSALQMDPASRIALRSIAHVLAEHDKDNIAAIRVIDRLIEDFGKHADDFASRGVLYARSGNREAAVADGEAALAKKRSGKMLFQVACIYALCAEKHVADADRAIQLVGQSITEDPRWLKMAIRDQDLSALRNHPRFRDLLRSAAHMQRLIYSGGPGQEQTTPATRAEPVAQESRASPPDQEH